VPGMIFLLGFRQHKAHGTSLAVMLPNVLVGLTTYSAAGYVHWPTAAALAPGGVIGAIAGAKMAHRLSSSKLKSIFGLFLLVVALRMLCDGTLSMLGLSASPPDGGMGVSDGFSAVLLAAGTGLAAGGLSGLLGVGGGFVMVPAMVYLLHLDQKLAQGISLLVIIPVALSGAAVHYTKGNVDIREGKWLALGGMGGSLLGAHWMRLASGETLRLVFGAFLLLMAWLTVRKR